MKRLTAFILVLFSLFTLSALTFSSSVISTDGDMKFSGGFYPVNGKFRYEADLPDAFDKMGLSLFLNFDGGLKHRLLVQNPENGEHITSTSSLCESDNARWYQVHYIYTSLDFEIGLINVNYLTSPLLALVVSLEGDFENAYERLGWLNTDGDEATFTVPDGKERKDRFKSYSGVLEFTKSEYGYRQLRHTGMKVGLEYNYTEETRMTKDGLWADLSLRYMPSWFPLHDGTGSSYVSVNADAGLAYTLLNINQFALSTTKDVLKMFSLVLESQFDARFIVGRGIPQYALERSMWGSHTANSMLLMGNTTKLVFKGPQILEDVYPVITLTNDIAYAFGPVANGSGSIRHLSGSVSLRGEANLFDTLYLYAECGWVYASVYEKDKGFRYSFGVRVGV